MLAHLIIGAILISVTVVIHAIALDRLMYTLEKLSNKMFLWFRMLWKAAMLTVAVLGVFCAHIVQIWLWALFYLVVGCLPDFETALYFSTSTFTTVGFGDVVLDEDWRLISSFQSANGFILFGWSTAFIFEVMSKLYHDETMRKNRKN
ncbi:MAG: two pore domain potassium channel family protein [Rhodospirillales bacterium]|nr:two pore domain potassium channel family protein [Rhodospirillales bacterium]